MLRVTTRAAPAFLILPALALAQAPSPRLGLIEGQASMSDIASLRLTGEAQSVLCPDAMEVQR